MGVSSPRNLAFVKSLYSNWQAIRSLLELKNYAFIRFAPPGHFYSPIPDMHQIESGSARIFDRSPRNVPAIEINEDSQIDFLNDFSHFYRDLPFPDAKSEGNRYYLDNTYFSYGDGIILYSFLRHLKPKRVVEVGSGFSSAEMLDTNDLFLDRQVQFTFVEPFPDRLFELLSEQDRANVKIEPRPVQEVEPGIFAALEANDILFIDSSHVAKTNSDVLYILFHILPRLKPGVIVHFHDILWPFEYPQEWLEEGRAWNEAYVLRAFLQYNPAFRILYFSSFMALHHADLLRKSMPRVLHAPSSKTTPGNSSLWLRKAL